VKKYANTTSSVQLSQNTEIFLNADLDLFSRSFVRKYNIRIILTQKLFTCRIIQYTICILVIVSSHIVNNQILDKTRD